MTAIDSAGDILFWAFPLFIPLLLIAHFRITNQEVVALKCLRRSYYGLYEKFGSPSARVIRQLRGSLVPTWLHRIG